MPKRASVERRPREARTAEEGAKGGELVNDSRERDEQIGKLEVGDEFTFCGQKCRVTHSQTGPFMNCEPDIQKTKAVAQVQFIGLEPI